MLAFDGFANLNTDPVRNRDEIDHHDGDGPRPETDVSETPVLADLALVLMVRPLLDKWVQPFGVFASAASWEDLYRLGLAAIIRLEARGVRILAVVRDGASTNMKLWKLAGAAIFQKGNEEDVKNTFAYSTISNREIFQLQDPPMHLSVSEIKCTIFLLCR